MSARRIMAKLLALVHKRRLDRDLDDEVRAHLELAEHDALSRGLSPEAARREARLRFGGIEQMKEEHRDRRGIRWLETLGRDFRYCLASLRRAPGFTIVVIGMLALGIGASTAIFSVADAVLLRPLPYPNPGQIVRVWEQAPDGHRMNLANLNFEDFRAQNNTFTNLVKYACCLPAVSDGTEPVRVNVAVVSSGFFKIFGVEPFRGHTFSHNEQILHGAPAAIVTYNYWQQYLGGAADLSKVRLKMLGQVYPVIGVMPAGFDFPRGATAWVASELYPDDSTRSAHNWHGLGRIRDGVTAGQARANLSTIAQRIKNEYGNKVDLSASAVVPLADAMVGNVRPALLTLLGAVGLLLLVACANVAGLLLARTSVRRKELAVRVALGAGRGRLIQQFLAESFLLSLAGGILGVLLATWAVKLLPAIVPANLPRQQGIAVNAPVLLFAFAVTLAVAISLGLFAAWRAASGNLQQALTAGSRSYTGASNRLRRLLVIGEIAMTLVILIGAGLLGRSFFRLISTSPGFRTQNLIAAGFSLPIPAPMLDQTDAARQVHLLNRIMARLRTLPGVENAAWAGAIPAAAGDNLAIGGFLILNGQKPPTNFDEWDRIAQNPSNSGQALYAVVGEDYFRTLGIPLIRGRVFNNRDSFNSRNVAIISQSLARQRWPDRNPIGQIIDFGNMDGNLKPLTIVGIVGDVRARGLNLPANQPIIYVDYRQRGMNANSSPTILLRSTAPPAKIDSAARAIFHRLAPQVPVQFSTFADEMGGWLAERRFLLLLVGVFATAALALAAIGIYGVVAFSVARRTQEIGVRMALGAQRSDVLRLVVGEGARMAALGVMIGIAVSLGVTRLLSSLLFGIGTTDPLTFIGVAGLLSVVALAASYIPARRAMRVDPMTALRYE
ncbi:MAG: ADOP family duplicated permease [Candidatus Acidiferrales bacterium]